MGRISSIKTQITPSKFSYWEPFHLSLVNGAGLGTCGLFNHTQPTIAIFLLVSLFNLVTKYHSPIMGAHSAPLSNAKDLSSDEGGYCNLTNWVVSKVRKRICIGLPNSRRGREEHKERKGSRALLEEENGKKASVCRSAYAVHKVCIPITGMPNISR